MSVTTAAKLMGIVAANAALLWASRHGQPFSWVDWLFVASTLAWGIILIRRRVV